MTKNSIYTKQAPQPIGCYSQAVKEGDLIYFSGQIGLDPTSMVLVEGVEEQARQAFKNMEAVAAAAGATLAEVIKLTIYITDMSTFPVVNQVMSEYFSEPYPARSTVGVKELPKGALVEVEGIIRL